MTVGLSEESSQWCHDHYRVVYSSIQHLERLHLQHMQSTRRAKVKKNVGFWDRVWGSPSIDTVHAPHEHYMLGDIGFYDEDATAAGSSESSSNDIGTIAQSYLDMKKAIKDSFVSGFFHKPHLIPSRNHNLSLQDLIKYLEDNLPSIRDHVYQIDAYSQTTNTDQLLCCELLHLGIHEHGSDCHGMTEGMLILAMLRQASKYQWKCLTQLIYLATCCKGDLGNVCNSKGDDILQEYSLEALDIIHDLVNKGLVENCSLLIHGAIKEACRYMNVMDNQDAKLGKLLYEASLDLVNAAVGFLQEYFLAFHATAKEIKSLASLIPHTYMAGLCRNIQESDTNNNANVNSNAGTCCTSSWYPNRTEMTGAVGVDEFDTLTKLACNVKARVSLLIALVLHPNLERFQPLIFGTRSTRNELLWRQVGTPPILDVAKVSADLDKVFEFIIVGVYLKNTDEAVSMLNEGIASKLSLLILGNTSTHLRDFVSKILACIFDNWLSDACANAMESTNNPVGSAAANYTTQIINFEKLSTASVWHDLVDYEIKWRQQHETRCRRAYIKNDTCSDYELYRDGGKVLIDLLQLFKELGSHLKCAFAVWSSACEIYKFTIPNCATRLFRYDGFSNQNHYKGPDVKLFNAKTLERLITPNETFCWWDRNSALLEIANRAASNANVLIDTYPRFLTEILRFGLHLATMSNASGDAAIANNGRRHKDCDTRFKVGYLLTHEAFRDIRLPFLLQRVVYQLANHSNGDYDALFTSIYKRILERDDQIETAAATFEIASKISGNGIDTNLDSSIKKLYTFPLVSGPLEVRAALTVLGLGGACPFGLFETAQAIFELVAICDPLVPTSPQLHIPAASDPYKFNIVLQKEKFDANVVFSVLNGRFQPGLEPLCSSLLQALASRHIIANTSAANVLDTLCDLLSQQPVDTCSVVSLLGRGLVAFSVAECKALCNAINSLLLSLPRKQRFKVGTTDWLLNLTKALLTLLPSERSAVFANEATTTTLTHTVQPHQGFAFGFYSELFQVLATIAKGPLAPKPEQSFATVYLLQQCLAPANAIVANLILTAPNIPSALELLHILLKRDSILLTLNNCSLPNVSVCPCCNLETNSGDVVSTQRGRPISHSERFFGSSWLSKKMRNINGLLSSGAHANSKHSTDEATIKDYARNKCTCFKLQKSGHVSLQYVHEAILHALNAPSPGASSILHIDFGLEQFNISSMQLQSIHTNYGITASAEYIHAVATDAGTCRAIAIILQLLARLGSRAHALFSGPLCKQLQGVYLTDKVFADDRSYIDYAEMDAEDLLLCNALEAHYKASLQKLDLSYFYASKLAYILNCTCNVLALQLLGNMVDSNVNAMKSTRISALLGDEDACLVALINLARHGHMWRFSDYKRLIALSAIAKLAKMSQFAQGILDAWPDVANVHDALIQPSQMSTLPFDALILHLQRLAITLHLILNASEHCRNVTLDLDALVKFYGQLIKVFCDATTSLNLQLIQAWQEKTTDYPKDASSWRFLTLWKRCRVLVDVVQLKGAFTTCCLDLAAVAKVDSSLVELCSRQNRNNWFITSAVALLHVISRVLFNAKYFAAAHVNLVEKVYNWLEFANVNFDPLHTSELSLCLHLVLVTSLTALWKQCFKSVSRNVKLGSGDADNIAPPNLNTSLGMARASIAIATILKLFEYLMLNQHTAQIRGKVYRCLSACLEFSGTRLAIDHLISYKVAPSRESNFIDSPLLLNLLFADASAEIQLGSGKNTVFVTCAMAGIDDADCCILGNDFSHFAWAEAMELGIVDMFARQGLQTANSCYAAALGYNAAGIAGAVDYRLEALTLLAQLLEGLGNVQASYLDLEAGVLQFGNLGIISVHFLQRLIEVRLAHGSCSSIDASVNGNVVGVGAARICSACMAYSVEACRILCAASGLQQFTTLWHSTRTDHDSVCLSSLYFDSHGLSVAISNKSAPLQLVQAAIGTVENILYIPSTKCRNALIGWLNRHADVLLTLVASPTCDVDVGVQLLCRMLRIHRICTLWLLAQHRSKNASANAGNVSTQVNGKTKNLRDFSLVFAELQCSFTLATSLPVVALGQLDTLLDALPNGSLGQWQCILLILQSLLPELGAFESCNDFVLASATKNVALQRLPHVSRAFEACGKCLVFQVAKLMHKESNVSLVNITSGGVLQRLVLACAAVECAATLAIHITTLLANVSSVSSSWLGIIDAILEACKGWGVGTRRDNGASLDNGVAASACINHLTPDDLEHVPFTNKDNAITGSNLKSVVLGMCNTLLILARLLG